MRSFRPEYLEIARLLVKEDEEDPITQCGEPVLYLLRNHAQNLVSVTSGTSTSSTALTENMATAQDAFTTLLHLARQKTTQTAFHAVSAPWLRLYVDATLGLVIASAFASLSIRSDANGVNQSHRSTCTWKRWVGMLDRAIIVAGAIGEGREEAVNKLIELVQEDFAPEGWYQGVQMLAEMEKTNWQQPNARKRRRSAEHPITRTLRPNQQSPRFAPRPISTLTSPPSISTYLRTPDLLNRPFVIKGYATPSDVSDSPSNTSSAVPCPALTRWRSAAYLLELTGPGRLVPVEVGSSYTSPEWGQRVVPWESFLEAVGYEMGPISDVSSSSANTGESSPSTDNVDADDGTAEDDDNRLSQNMPTYLAQHPLLTHFPALANDLEAALSPEYIFSAPPAPAWFEEYVPPGCGEGVVRNVWVGSGGRKAKGDASNVENGQMDIEREEEEVVGPVVLGRKRVWVAPPSVSSEHMYAFSDASANGLNGENDSKPGKSGKAEESAGEGGNGDATSVPVDAEGRPDIQPSTSPAPTPSPLPSDLESDAESGLLTSYMTNTSRVPIFTPCVSHPNNPSLASHGTTIASAGTATRSQFPAFYEHAWPQSMEIVLEPGDLLVMPPKWWHAMRSEGEGVVWSVSMWY
ncbi:hypothetical protein QFC24_000814 [Naganishia onofrii]|uniref:Uncharacterized protein n=1 Tax=Naganishia onofrii TaxID=1851511 RepID=A0ACC2XVY3_9TREE|nr:hypothetical protein QFC24_000814 [Naganishia onofrii]